VPPTMLARAARAAVLTAGRENRQSGTFAPCQGDMSTPTGLPGSMAAARRSASSVANSSSSWASISCSLTPRV
jgi:hypothetical protein